MYKIKHIIHKHFSLARQTILGKNIFERTFMKSWVVKKSSVISRVATSSGQARSIQTWLGTFVRKEVVWPAQSTDLKLIEHLSDELMGTASKGFLSNIRA